MRDSTEKHIHRRRVMHRWVLVLTVFALLLTVLMSAWDLPESAAARDEDSGEVAAILRGSEIVILSSYKESMKIGETKTLIASASGGVEIRWKSSAVSVAAVDPTGVVTARKAGTCQIIAKTRYAEARCTVVVEPTVITLNARALSIENGATFQMEASTSNNAPVTWKSSRQSVAIISDTGLIRALKPGTSVITATADGSKETCALTVMKPSVRLSADEVRLYRNQCTQLQATVSSDREVTWSSNRPSVAIVDEYGKVTAIRHGEARIRAKVDGVSRYCVVKVQSPTIRLDKKSLTLKTGQTFQLHATVSSGVMPEFSCSSKRVATVTSDGVIRAKAKGSCTIRVKEDGTIATCKIKVIE